MATLTLAPGEKDPRKIADVVRQLSEGRSNATGTFTLTASAVMTAVPAPTCAPGSNVHFAPASADAAAAMATTYILPANVTTGQFVVSHASAASTDRLFFYEIRG